MIDSAHLKFIETDTAITGNALAGDAFTQQTSFPAGQLVFTLGGLDSTLNNPLAVGGFVTTDANGTLSNGTEDYNDVGTPDLRARLYRGLHYVYCWTVPTWT